jgi:two-component system, cell cycle sensor histidine kinase and response regulator CckA
MNRRRSERKYRSGTLTPQTNLDAASDGEQERSPHNSPYLCGTCMLRNQNGTDIYLVARFSDGQIMDVNDTATAVYGYTRRELLALTFRDLHSSETIPFLAGQMEQAETDGALYESTHRRKDGTAFPVEIRSSVIVLNGERLLLNLVRDISKAKESEAKLARSEEQLRLMFKELMSAVALHEIICDADGKPIDYRFLDVNPMFEAMTGLKRADIIGKTVMTIMPQTESYWIERYGRVALTGVHEQFENYAASLGKYYDVRAYCPERGKFAVMFHDITDRKRVEQTIRESELRYRSVIEQTVEGVFLMDVHTKRILEANRAFCVMLGYTAAELQKVQLYSIIAGKFEEVNTNIYQILDSGQAVTGEQQYIAKNGKTVDVEFSASILQMGGKRMLVMVVRDMTDRKKNEETKRQLQKMESLGIMAGGIAHDFNNLLQVVLGQTAIALRHIDQGNAAADHLEKAKKAIMRAADLTQNLLSYSGKGRFNAQVVSLNEVIRQNLQLIETSLPKNAQLVLHLHDAVRSVYGDRQHIQQVVMNLIINAGEAITDRGGTVTLSTSMEEVYLWDSTWTERTGEPLDPGFYSVLEVLDDGCGMNKETISKLFDPFFSTKFSGRGLGLAAVFGIVRGHRGGLMLESEEGRGTKFRLAFPAIGINAEEPMADESVNNYQLASGVVLIVDDEEMVREVVGDILENSGFKSIAASGGEQALSMYAEHRDEIKVVLLDLSMPGMSGEETFVRLRSIDPRAHIVISSGYSEAEVRAKFVALGEVSGFIQKPYQSDALVKKLSPYFALK